MIRRSPPILAVLLALLCPAVAAADEPGGPRLAAIELIERKELGKEPAPSMALALVDPSTGKEKRYLRERMDAPGRIVPAAFGRPAWSPDGSLVAFAAHDGRSRQDKIYVVAADGSGLRAIPGTAGGADPVLSPDGRTLAFSRNRTKFHLDPDFFKDPTGGGFRTYSSTTAWIVDLVGGKPRRLTRWRNGLHNQPTSFAPDGSTFLLTRKDNSTAGPRVMWMSLADGTIAEVLPKAEEAVFSPDGSRIAFVGYLHPDLVEAEENHDYLAAELYVASADGTRVKRLSRTADVLESSPGWDPSGQRLAYVQFRGDTSFVAGLALLFPRGNALMQVNVDGSCREKIASRPRVAFYGVAWQPGPGREAGPISC